MARSLIVIAALIALVAPAQAQLSEFSMRGWETDFSKIVVKTTEIIDVIAKDAIPAIDAPTFKPAIEEASIPGNEPVVAFAHNGVARAYPVRYLMWHEIVNDTVGGLPVAVTYCPLCNTAIVFDRRLDGKPVTFGTTGKLRNSDLIMYDRGEENWWQQFSGRAIVGKRAGDKLKSLPSFLISFDLFRERYPDGEVLEAHPSRAAQSGINPYRGYDTAKLPFLFRGQLPEDIEPMMRIAYVEGENPIAIALPYLQENAPVTRNGYEFRWSAGQASALDSGIIADGRDVGNIEVYRIEPGKDPEPAVYTVTFAFAARAFEPDLEIVQ